MAFPQNERGVEEILALLTPRILGRQLPAWNCQCGACGCGPAVAVAVRPGGIEPRYHGQETEWFMWSVCMKSTDPKHADEDFRYGTGIEVFVPSEELEEIFAKVFPTKRNMTAVARVRARAAQPTA